MRSGSYGGCAVCHPGGLELTEKPGPDLLHAAKAGGSSGTGGLSIAKSPGRRAHSVHVHIGRSLSIRLAGSMTPNGSEAMRCAGSQEVTRHVRLCRCDERVTVI